MISAMIIFPHDETLRNKTLFCVETNRVTCTNKRTTKSYIKNVCHIFISKHINKFLFFYLKNMIHMYSVMSTHPNPISLKIITIHWQILKRKGGIFEIHSYSCQLLT